MAQAAKKSSQASRNRPVYIDLTNRIYSPDSEGRMHEETPLGYFDAMGRRVYLRLHHTEVSKARISPDALIRLAKKVSSQNGPFVICKGVSK